MTPNSLETQTPHEEKTPKSNKGVWVVVLILLAAGFAVSRFLPHAATQAQTKRGGRGASNLPVPVVGAVARLGEMPVYMDGIGSATAFYTVQLRTRVDGQIMTVNFREGQLVKEGDSLIEIDPRPYQVQLEQARGQLAKDQALLRQARANEARDQASQKYATAEARRYGQLFDEGIVSREQGDQFQTTANTMSEAVSADRAAIDSAQAQTVADQAAIDNAMLQLVYAHITSPISGRIGLRLVDPGNIVHASDTNPLAVITQLQPIAVVFSLPEDSLPEIEKRTAGGQSLAVFAYDRDMKVRIATGKLLSIDNQIDQSTGTVKLKAIFDNHDLSLFPNQFVNARLLIDTRHGVVIIPTAAVQHSSESAFVYVLTPKHTVEVRNIAAGVTEGDLALIEKGVAAGDTVVIDGIDKLHDGSPVTVRIAAGR